MSNQIGFNSGTACSGTGSDHCLPELDYTVKPTVRVTGKTGYCDIRVQMWDTIGCEEDNIVRVYNKGDCVCLDGKYYFSKIDKNLDKPGVDTTTWSEGYSQCDLLNPLLDKYISNATISGRTITITRSDGETFNIVLPEDKDTYGHVLNNGDGTYTWINADGSTGDSWTGSPHPDFPDDIHVTNFEINGDTAVVTLSDGSSFTQTITHPSGDPEKYIVDAVIDGNANTITYTYNDGTSFTKPHPAGDSAPSITNLTKTVDFTGPTSDLVVESSDGTDTAPFSLTDPRLFPSANFKYVPKVVGTTTDVTGVEKPVASLKNVILKGGFILGGTDKVEFVIPRDGMYDVTFASNAYWNAEDGSEPRAKNTYTDGAADIAGFRMNLNGNPIDGFGTPEWGFARTGNYHYKTMRIEFEAKAGDLVSAETYLDPNLIMKVHQGPIKGTIKRISDI